MASLPSSRSRTEEQNIESVKIVSLRRVGGDSERTLMYAVLMDEFFKEEITMRNGRHIWYVILKKESPQSGWKIDEMGTGP